MMRVNATAMILRTLIVALASAAIACRAVPGRDVRFEPTPMAVVRTMLEIAAVGPQDIVYDLGSGDGRIAIAAAKEFGARAVGVEIDAQLVARARENARTAGVQDRVQFILGDMYAADVSSATVVTLFLHPEPNLKLRPRLQSQLKPGSRVVSYIWDMGEWKPDEARRVSQGRQVFLWRIPGRHLRDGVTGQRGRTPAGEAVQGRTTGRPRATRGRPTFNRGDSSPSATYGSVARAP